VELVGVEAQAGVLDHWLWQQTGGYCMSDD